ncbi:hypothetical protein [Escherichia coli]
MFSGAIRTRLKIAARFTDRTPGWLRRRALHDFQGSSFFATISLARR